MTEVLSAEQAKKAAMSKCGLASIGECSYPDCHCLEVVEPLSTQEGENPIEYYIQDARFYVGNSVMWWKPDGKGYTVNVDQAWRVSKEKADSITKSRSTDKAWLCADIDIRATQQFDMQLFREISEAVHE